MGTVVEDGFGRGPLWIRVGFFGAAAFNIVGILTVSRLLSADLGRWDPLFDVWGCGLVVVWGLAYLSLAWRPFVLPWLAAVFMVEKIVYAVHFALWHARTNVAVETIAEADPLAASFLGGYGLGDAIFAVFFGYVWVSGLLGRPRGSRPPPADGTESGA